MKKVFPIIIFSILLTAFSVQRFDSPEIIQMVITLPGLESRELQKDLEADIEKLAGIEFVEASLMSKTMVINYDSQRVSPKDVEYILDKWECSAGTSSFQSLVAMQ